MSPRTIPLIILVLGVALYAFGYWGVGTEAGRRAYDEMAGILPTGAGFLGAALIAIGLVYLLLRADR